MSELNHRRKVKLGSAEEQMTDAGRTLNEKIMKECYDLYSSPGTGLCVMAEALGQKLMAPRKQVVIALFGNHSAGKSSFINWYIEEHILRTGVAIETQGITLVTSGRKRETLTGTATLRLFPHLRPMKDMPGLLEYLSTEVSTSKQKKFPLVTFIDTPGLVDGGLVYPFDVNKTLRWIGENADLVFVFFDPMGQALCKRTVDLVEGLSSECSDRLRFYLSKADEAGTETDRQRVLMQIVQELCKRPGLNRTCFDMPTIYIPRLDGKPVRCVNQIEEVCTGIEKTINLTIQNTLNSLDVDCDKLAADIDATVAQDELNRTHNRSMFCRTLFLKLCLYSTVVVFLLCLTYILLAMYSLQATKGAHSLSEWLTQIEKTYHWLPQYVKAISCTSLYVTCLPLITILYLCLKYCTSRKQTYDKIHRQALMRYRRHLHEVVKSRKKGLYTEYLDQCRNDNQL